MKKQAKLTDAEIAAAKHEVKRQFAGKTVVTPTGAIGVAPPESPGTAPRHTGTPAAGSEEDKDEYVTVPHPLRINVTKLRDSVHKWFPNNPEKAEDFLEIYSQLFGVKLSKSVEPLPVKEGDTVIWVEQPDRYGKYRLGGKKPEKEEGKVVVFQHQVSVFNSKHGSEIMRSEGIEQLGRELAKKGWKIK